mmetsp:Transcript_11074/g.23457  ORF Transcript_11074/g.23457 Transcript_11074/m.23457 type:complete len:240 (+) Transcript_11074:528-1247(+)
MLRLARTLRWRRGGRRAHGAPYRGVVSLGRSQVHGLRLLRVVRGAQAGGAHSRGPGRRVCLLYRGPAEAGLPIDPGLRRRAHVRRKGRGLSPPLRDDRLRSQPGHRASPQGRLQGPSGGRTAGPLQQQGLPAAPGRRGIPPVSVAPLRRGRGRPRHDEPADRPRGSPDRGHQERQGTLRQLGDASRRCPGDQPGTSRSSWIHGVERRRRRIGTEIHDSGGGRRGRERWLTREMRAVPCC